MNSIDGKTKGTIGKRNQINGALVSGGERGFTTQSAISRIQGYLQDDQGIGIRASRPEYGDTTSANTGKILGRLENLEKRFFSYVRSHQERLDLRKKESEVAEEEFAKEVAELKQDILALMQQTEDPK